jgi:prevent-host-death family protein
MIMTTISIAEGKRDFSRLIQRTVQSNEEIVITRRGKPMAVIISHDQFQRLRKLEGYRRVMQARERFISKGIRADKVYRESKALLEKRQ